MSTHPPTSPAASAVTGAVPATGTGPTPPAVQETASLVILADTVLLVFDPQIADQQWEDTYNTALLATLATINKTPLPAADTRWFTAWARVLNKPGLWKTHEGFSFTECDSSTPAGLRREMIARLADLLNSDQLDQLAQVLDVDPDDPTDSSDDSEGERPDPTDPDQFTHGSIIVAYVTPGQSGPRMIIAAAHAHRTSEENLLTALPDTEEDIVKVSTAELEHVTDEYARPQPGKGSLRQQIKTKLGERRAEVC